MLGITRQQWLAMIAEAWRVYPLEACGLLIGVSAAVTGSGGDAGLSSAEVTEFVPIHNAAESSKVYSLEGSGFSKAALRADKAGLQLIGVMHSHTHTLAYPSSTDVAEGTQPLIPPEWHWPILSLAGGYPELRSFRFGTKGDRSGDSRGIVEEPIRFLR